MKKILLLSTGGTIASAPGEDGLVPRFTGEEMIGLIPRLKGLCQIESRAIISLDSSNMQPEEWLVMAREAYRGLQSFDGVVITHGTDTLAYSSAILSFMLSNLDKPVVFTGSQLPIDVPGTDARRNLLHAFITACQCLPGVFVVFDGKIMRGTRAVKVRSTGFNAFESINAPDVGRMEAEKIIIEAAPPYSREGRCPDTPAELMDNLDDGVFLLKLVPGTRPGLLQEIPGLGYSGLVIESFGSGGLPFHRRDLLPEIEKLLEKNIPVAVTTQCLREGTDLTVYEVGRKAARAGVISGGDMTTEALVTKLMWTLGQTGDMEEIRKIMQTNLCGEIGPAG